MKAIITVLKTGGEYNENHVEWLQRQIGRTIICITDSTKPMKNVITEPMKYNWPKWWAKMEIFHPDVYHGDFLYTDLDTVFLKGCPEWDLMHTTVLADMYGQDHMNSGLMYIKHGDKFAIWREWLRNPDAWMKKYHGDQDFLNQYWNDKPRLQDIKPLKVVSYKADILKESISTGKRLDRGDLSTANIVVFHGQPRPWDVNHVWIPKLEARHEMV